MGPTASDIHPVSNQVDASTNDASSSSLHDDDDDAVVAVMMNETCGSNDNDDDDNNNNVSNRIDDNEQQEEIVFQHDENYDDVDTPRNEESSSSEPIVDERLLSRLNSIEDGTSKNNDNHQQYKDDHHTFPHRRDEQGERPAVVVVDDHLRSPRTPRRTEVDRKLLSKSYVGDEDDDNYDDDDHNMVGKCRRASRRSCRACYTHCWDSYPRCMAIVVRIMFPLCLLLTCAIFGGWILAEVEYPQEAVSNDLIMAYRKILSEVVLPPIEAWVDGAQSSCLSQALENYSLGVGTNNNTTLVDINNTTLVDIGWNTTTVELDDLGENFSIPQLVDEIKECYQSIEPISLGFEELSADDLVPIALSELSFNWMRCWNESQFGPLATWIPTQDQIDAARNQSEFYSSSWKTDFEYWLTYYTEHPQGNGTSIYDIDQIDLSNTNLTGLDEAFIKALKRATGSSQCFLNRAGTAWFFFTIMTTIGYGNQSAVTMEGRLVVVIFGFVSMLLFGGILASSGNVVAVIYDDFVKKIRWSALARPFWSMLFWMIVTALYTIWMGAMAYKWWKWRIEEDAPSIHEGFWFAYLTTTTVGLGDYYFQPEVIFMADTFSFAFIVLAAFVFFAAFLTRLSDFVLGEFPDTGEIFKIRLEETTLMGAIPQRLYHKIFTRICVNPIESMQSEAVGAEETTTEGNGDEDETDPYGDNDAILDLIVQYSKCEKRTLAVVRREEELLGVLLDRIRKERIKLQLTIPPRPAIVRQAHSRQLLSDMEQSFPPDNIGSDIEVAGTR